MKNETRDPRLLKCLKEFFTSYLPAVRKMSPHTVSSYRDAMNLYFTFLDRAYGIQLRNAVCDDFCQEKIVNFMKWLAESRHNEATTVNQRLSHLKGFCRYLKKKDILSAIGYEEICDISEVKDERTPEFIWLSIDEVRLILEQVNLEKQTGIRDRFYLSLMYESGCRDDEMLHLRVKDFIINKGEPEIHIFGKGNKHRCTPISKEILPYYDEYCELFHTDRENGQEELLFYTIRNGIKTQMSPDNVQRFMRTYEERARRKKPDIPHLHPHLFRRTRAMHLYLAGVPLPLVSEWLGHSNEETTRIYARATDEMKREAQKKMCTGEDALFKDDVAFKYADDEDVLKKLCGLK